MSVTLTLNPALDRELVVPSLAFDEVLRASETRVDLGGKGSKPRSNLDQTAPAPLAREGTPQQGKMVQPPTEGMRKSLRPRSRPSMPASTPIRSWGG